MKFFLTGASGFIGTHIVNAIVERGDELVNFDDQEPQLAKHKTYWIRGNILESEAIAKAVSEAAPDVFVHLAARTDCDETTTVEEGYKVNTDGVTNVLNAIKQCPSIERVIMTSTQYVSGPGRLPEHDQDYFPHTVYGQSKVIGEQLTREANLSCTWCFIRPVNIWGPYHPRYEREFWRIAAKGLYVHPNVPAPTRAYGYIGNVIWQIMRILEMDTHKIQGKAIYVGDKPISIDKWSKGFYRAFCGRDPWNIPLSFMKGLGFFGDIISRFSGKPFYITSSRLSSMTQDYLAPVAETDELLGEPPYSLEEGICETVNWYNSRHR